MVAMPSSRPMKPIFSEVVALTETRRTSMPQMRAMLLRIAADMRADLRALGDDGQVEIDDAAAARRTRSTANGKKGRRGRAVPFLVARREMRADVAFGQRAEQGVGQHVQPGIGVRMTLEPPVVRDGDAAEDDGVAGHERMNVVAVADPGFHLAIASQDLVGAARSPGG